MVLPELALTGYTCSDLFWQSQMIDAAKEGLKEIADGTKETDALIFCRTAVGTGRKAVQCSRCALSRRASRHCAEKVSAELQ